MAQKEVQINYPWKVSRIQKVTVERKCLSTTSIELLISSKCTGFSSQRFHITARQTTENALLKIGNLRTKLLAGSQMPLRNNRIMPTLMRKITKKTEMRTMNQQARHLHGLKDNPWIRIQEKPDSIEQVKLVNSDLMSVAKQRGSTI